MSHLKTKLMVSAVSLLLAVALLAASAFAWFSLSTNPEITGISATVAANENLEIALAQAGEEGALLFVDPSAVGDSGNGYTWGNLVAFSPGGTGEVETAYAAFLEDFDALRPMTIDTEEENIFRYPVYMGNGRTEETGPLIEENTYGMGTMYLEQETEEGTEKIVYGFFLDFWFRTNYAPEDADEDFEGTPVVLSAADNRSSGGEMGGGSVFAMTLTFTEEDGDEETDPAEAYLIFAQNLRIAFLDVTPDLGIEGIEPAASDAEITILSAPFAAVSESDLSVDDDGNSVITVTLTSEEPLLYLKKNEAKVLRVYIYLDGVALENLDAEVPLAQLDASLNLQFALKDVELHSMDEVESNS